MHADRRQTPKYPPLRIDESYVARLEGWCDEFNAELPRWTRSSCPAAPPAPRCCTRARVVTRRAERSTWALIADDPQRTNPLTARYLNRLSDLLFILCRVANPAGDVLWEPGAGGS